MLPSRNRALEIANNVESFYVVEEEVQGFKVEMFNYRLGRYGLFKKNDAFELRGLTFIQDEDGEWHRHLALHKFFNLNENEDQLFERVKDKEIASVQGKIDGSMITFVKLPNGNIVAKSKMSFISPQAKEAQRLFDANHDLRIEVRKLLDNGFTPIFEFTSPQNQVVIWYDFPELTLLQVRDVDGRYTPASKLKEIGDKMRVNTAVPQEKTLEEMVELQENCTEDIEGWVVFFSDGTAIKIKTKSYLARHGSVSDLRENIIIQLTLDKKIDDVLSMMPPESTKYQIISEISDLASDKYNHIVSTAVIAAQKYAEGKDNEARGEVAKALKKEANESFHSVMASYGKAGQELEDAIEKYVYGSIIKNTNKLEHARKWLKEGL